LIPTERWIRIRCVHRRVSLFTRPRPRPPVSHN
jgi:hypothetical protein